MTRTIPIFSIVCARIVSPISPSARATPACSSFRAAIAPPLWGDQSLINLWMASLGIRPIHDYRFNFQVRLLEQSREKAAYRDVRIFHMNGWNHLPCTEYMIHVSFFFFFTLPAGRRLYPSYIRLMIREDNLRLKFGIGTFVRWTELFRRICWHLRRIPRAILYA